MAKPVTVKIAIDYPAGRPADFVAWQTNATGRSKAALALHCAYLHDRFGVRLAGLANVAVTVTGSDWIGMRAPPFRVEVDGVLARAPDEKDSMIEKHHPELLTELDAP